MRLRSQSRSSDREKQLCIPEGAGSCPFHLSDLPQVPCPSLSVSCFSAELRVGEFLSSHAVEDNARKLRSYPKSEI